MAKYEEMKTLRTDDVYNLCIIKKWYTKGSAKSYSKLFDKINDIEESGESITVDQLAELAEDILENSNTDYNVESIMWELNKVANTSFVVKKH